MAERDEDFQGAFAGAYMEAETQFVKITSKYYAREKGIRLSKDDRPLTGKMTTLKDFEEQLASTAKQFKSEREKHQSWTKVLSAMGGPIESLGGLTSGIMSAAFPMAPSSLAFNAISFLFQVGHSVSEEYDALTSCFSQISDFLQRLSARKPASGQMPQELKNINHRMFVSVIIVCALAYQYMKQNLFGKYLRNAALGGSSKIQEQLQLMQALADSDQKMTGALSLRDIGNLTSQLSNMSAQVLDELEGIASKIDSLQPQVRAVLEIEQTRDAREKDSHRERQRKQIRDIMGQDGVRTMEANEKEFEARFIDKAGAWFLEHPTFKQWIDKQVQVLVGHGATGSGKSVIAAKVLEQLKRLSADPRNQTIAFGHFFRPNNNSLQTVRSALQSMVITVADSDSAYPSFFEEKFKMSGAQLSDHLWDRALLTFFKSTEHQRPNHLYVVFDGVHHLKPAEKRRLVELIKQLRSTAREEPIRIQVLLFDEPPSNDAADSGAVIKADFINISAQAIEDDMRQYVAERILELSPLTREFFRRVEGDFETQILRRAAGSFDNIDSQLVQIANLRTFNEIDDMVRGPAVQSNNAIKDSMSRLRSLPPWQIEQLRLILQWLIHGYDSDTYTLEFIADVLDQDARRNNEERLSNGVVRRLVTDHFGAFIELIALDAGESSSASNNNNTGEPLGHPSSLLSKFASPISALPKLTIPNVQSHEADIETAGEFARPGRTLVRTKNESVRKYFLDQEKLQSFTSPPTTIHESEIRIVKHFLKQVCDDDLYRRFGFDDFFTSKAQAEADLIFIKADEARLNCLSVCLSVLNNRRMSRPKEGEVSLVSHARSQFTRYLKIDDLAKVSTEQGSDIVSDLWWMFHDNDIVYEWLRDRYTFGNEFLKESRSGYGADSEVADWPADHLMKWLGEERFRTKLSPSDRDFLTRISADTFKSRGRARFYRYVMVEVSRGWLCGQKWDPVLCFAIFSDYLQSTPVWRDWDYSPVVSRENSPVRSSYTSPSPSPVRYRRRRRSSTSISPIRSRPARSEHSTSTSRPESPDRDEPTKKTPGADDATLLRSEPDSTVDPVAEGSDQAQSSAEVDRGEVIAKADDSHQKRSSSRSDHRERRRVSSSRRSSTASLYRGRGRGIPPFTWNYDDVTQIVDVAWFFSDFINHRFYERVGKTILMAASTFNTSRLPMASEYFCQALSMSESEDVHSWSGLGLVRFEQAEYAEAVRCFENAVFRSEGVAYRHYYDRDWISNMVYIASKDLLIRLGVYEIKRGHLHTAVCYFGKSTEDDHRGTGHSHLLAAWNELGEHQLIVAHLRKMDSMDSSPALLDSSSEFSSVSEGKSTSSVLIECFTDRALTHSFHFMVRSSVLRLGNSEDINFLKDVYTRAIDKADNMSRSASLSQGALELRRWLGGFTFVVDRDISATTRLYKACIKGSADWLNRDEVEKAHFGAVEDLASIYLEGGQKYMSDTQQSAPLYAQGSAHFLDLLRDLQSNMESAAPKSTLAYSYCVSSVPLRLARWAYRWQGDAQQARSQLKPNVKLGIEQLSNATDEDDLEAYDRLCKSFMVIGDDVNALAAASALGWMKMEVEYDVMDDVSSVVSAKESTSNNVLDRIMEDIEAKELNSEGPCAGPSAASDGHALANGAMQDGIPTSKSEAGSSSDCEADEIRSSDRKEPEPEAPSAASSRTRSRVSDHSQSPRRNYDGRYRSRSRSRNGSPEPMKKPDDAHGLTESWIRTRPDLVEARKKDAERQAAKQAASDKNGEIPTMPNPIMEAAAFQGYCGTDNAPYCGKSFQLLQDVWYCRDCFAVMCTDCYGKRQIDKDARFVCDTFHELLYIPLPKEPLPKNHVLYHGKPVKLDDWKAIVRAEWDIELDEPAQPRYRRHYAAYY